VEGAAGFTLVELAVVLFIISLFLAIVIPSFSTSPGGGLKAEARRAASMLRQISDTSASRKETVALTFDLTNKLARWPEEGGDRAESFETLRAVELQSRGRVDEGELTVLFDPLVSAEAMRIYLADDEGRSLEVTFNPISRRVKISEPGQASDS